mgnify:CR=1 FL=1
MKEFRDNNFNEKQIKGLDMVMRALAKQYKFVKGWQLDDKYEEYKYTLYIDMIIDINKVDESLERLNNKSLFESLLIKASFLLSISFLVSSVIITALYLIVYYYLQDYL